MRSYVAAKSEGTVAPSLFRLVLVGEEAAGKSTLLRALSHQPVDITQNLRTDGIDSCILSNFEPDKATKTEVILHIFNKNKSRSRKQLNPPSKQAPETHISVECYDFAGQEI